MQILKSPNYGRHVVFVGATGSGKSYLAEKLLANYQRFIFIDTQHAYENKDAKTAHNLRELKKLLSKKTDKIIYQPWVNSRTPKAWYYVFAMFDKISSKNKKNPYIIYIDELYHVGYGVSFPRSLPQAITTARQKGLSYWISTQRPANIPIPVLSESSQIYVFYLSREDDNKIIASLTRNKKETLKNLNQLKRDHSFYLIDNMAGSAEFYEKPRF